MLLNKWFKKVSKRSSLKDRPNRNENGIINFIDSYVTYYDVNSSNNIN
ncbi:MAG: hypothetical protein J6X03_01070 [Bacilli bacterium]|nr:hypothetical protein [Bacilli bacterium]